MFGTVLTHDSGTITATLDAPGQLRNDALDRYQRSCPKRLFVPIRFRGWGRIFASGFDVYVEK